jgi:hypothetical protein
MENQTVNQKFIETVITLQNFRLNLPQYQTLVRLAKGQKVKRGPVLNELVEHHCVRIGMQPFPLLTHLGEVVLKAVPMLVKEEAARYAARLQEMKAATAS